MGATQTAAAFTATTIVFALLLVAASVVVSTASSEALRPVRMTGPAVKRWSGYVLLAVGAWFIVLAALPSPILGS
ncbi:MAG: hypothetical protein ACE5MI_10010 [Acidimicrobiia bacterium]